MALESQIDSAVYQATAPVGNDEGWHLLALAKASAEAEALERQRATRNVLHGPDRHGCTPDYTDAGQCVSACHNPDHDRDADIAAEVLEALGLIPYRYEAGQSPVRWCGRCKQNRPGTEFDDDTIRIRGGTVVACCRSCAEARRVARRRTKRKKTA